MNDSLKKWMPIIAQYLVESVKYHFESLYFSVINFAVLRFKVQRVQFQLNHTTQLNRGNLLFKSTISDVNAKQSLNAAPHSRQELAVRKPLRVMMLGLRGFPKVEGGVEAHAEHLAPLLVLQGCEVEVIVRSTYYKDDANQYLPGLTLKPIWAPKSNLLEAIVHTFLGVVYAAIKRPDVLHIHAIGPALMTPLARLLGLRVVVTHHGPDYNRQKWGLFARNILKLGEYLGMRLSNQRIVISSTISDLVATKHTKSSHLIHNGVVMPSLSISDEYLAQFGLIKNQYILLVSRLVPEKRHLDLILAFNQANLVDVKLVLVGSLLHSDAYTQSVMKAAGNNPNIVLTGFQTGDTLSSLYTHAGLFVLPSSHEGLSISLLEALSYGLPVLASNIAPNTELGLSDEDYFSLGDVDELSAALTKKMRNITSGYEQTNTDKLAIRDWVSSRYNWQLIAEKTYKTYLLCL